MGGYLSNGNHASEGIKSLMPDVQQYWSTAHSEGMLHVHVYNVFSAFIDEQKTRLLLLCFLFFGFVCLVGVFF